MYIVLHSKDKTAKVLIGALILFIGMTAFFLISLTREVVKLNKQIRVMEEIVHKNIELNIQAKESNNAVLNAFGEKLN